MTTLYQISSEYMAVLDGGMVVDEDTGEVLFDDSNLDELQAAFEDKLEACALYLKNLESDAEAIKAEEKTLADRRRTIERKAERMRDYVSSCVQDVAGCKFETPRVSLSLRKSKRVEVFDLGAVPGEYVVRKETIQPDKKAIKDAIGSGESVPGAVVRDCFSLQVK